MITDKHRSLLLLESMAKVVRKMSLIFKSDELEVAAYAIEEFCDGARKSEPVLSGEEREALKDA